MRACACVHERVPVCARACACVISSSLLLLLFYSGVIHSNASKLCSADFGALVFVAKKKKKCVVVVIWQVRQKSRCAHDLTGIAFRDLRGSGWFLVEAG